MQEEGKEQIEAAKSSEFNANEAYLTSGIIDAYT
jgi:hypothetical protein